MIPNYKRPVFREHIYNRFEEPLTDEDLDMIEYVEGLEEEIKELELTVGIREKRGLISRFDREYDEEDKKKNPDRSYAGVLPDAEEVYKRYYELKDKCEKLDSDLYSANQVIHDLVDAVEDNERLKKLCDEYEKEHVTTFEIWKKYNHVVDDIRTFLVDRINGYGNVDDLSDEERGFYYGYKRVLYEMERLCD